MSVEQLTARILREIHADAAGNARSPADRLVDACSVATGAAGTSLTWCTANSVPLTIAATEGAGMTLERLSFLVGDGPQAECVRTGRNISRATLKQDAPRWPGFVPEAIRVGVNAVFAFPLRLGAISLGVLTLYRASTGTLSDEQYAASMAYVAAATALLLDQPRGGEPGTLPAVLEDPFLLQAEVHQATGMIAAHLNTNLVTALSLLRAHAYSHSRPMSTVARDIVTRRLTLT